MADKDSGDHLLNVGPLRGRRKLEGARARRRQEKHYGDANGGMGRDELFAMRFQPKGRRVGPEGQRDVNQADGTRKESGDDNEL